MSLSIQQCAELKALAEREAPQLLQRVLALRHNRDSIAETVADANAHALLRFAEAHGITNRSALEEVAHFYGPEVNRQMESLFDLGVAALGIATGKSETV